MKVKIMAILMLVAISCRKENIPEGQSLNSNSSSDASVAAQLISDPNFVKLYKISSPIFSKLRTGRVNLSELKNDDVITYDECNTLAPKLGFADSVSLVNYFHEVYSLCPKIVKSHPGLNFKQCQQAIMQLNQTNMMPEDPCQDAVIGTFISNVTQCGALGLIPVIGEALAGTCMVGALITYNSGLQACAEQNPT